MISHIKMVGFRGTTRGVDLGPRTLITGRNGAGKTSIIHAAALCLNGYIPGQQKRAKDILESCGKDLNSVECTIDGKKIARNWKIGKTGSVSETFTIDGSKFKGSESEGIITMALGYQAQIFDMHAFWTLPPRQQMISILKTVVGADADKILDGERAARDKLAAARADRQEAEKAVVRLQERLAKLPALVQDRDLAAKLTALEAQSKELRERVTEGQKNDAIRTEKRKQLATVADWKSTQETAAKKMDAAKALGIASKKWLADLGPIPYPIAEDLVASETVKQLLVDTKELIRVDGGNNVFADIIERIDAVLNAEAHIAENAEHQKKVDDTEKKLEAAATQYRDAFKDHKLASDRLAEMDAIAKELEQIGPGATDEDVATLAGMDERLSVMRKDREGMIERETIEREIEAANVRAAEVTANEDKVKAEVEKAIAEIHTAGADAVMKVADRAKHVLPTGGLSVERDGDEYVIGWLRDRFVPRAGLSGGEAVLFDAALGYALSGEKAAVFIDAGEVDDASCEALFETLEQTPIAQVIIARWSPRAQPPKGWTTITL